MTEYRKRKADERNQDTSSKRKKSKNWSVPRKQTGGRTVATIDPGDAGIWITCVKGKEGKCVGEFRELLDEYIDPTSGTATSDRLNEKDNQSEDGNTDDIEATIGKELSNFDKDVHRKAYEPVKVDTPCLLFFKTLSPVDPAELVHRICTDAGQQLRAQRSRFVQRLTPVTIIGRATETGLGEVAKVVLEPHFHQPGQEPKKFAIRPTIRNHSQLGRDAVIQQIAGAVGPPHTVDLKHYDALVLVDIWKNICGMAVVGRDYEILKRYNLQEIYAADAKDGSKE